MNNYQNTLFPYAYNILGSVEDAKDVIQDVIIKSLTSENKHINNKVAYLIKSVINQSINLKKRNHKHVTGVWLPEPISTESADTNLNRREYISYSLMILLELLNPNERAVFILKEGFNYSHSEISEIMGTSVDNSRKLLSRGKQKLENNTGYQNSDYTSEDSSYMQSYIQAIKKGDTKLLEKLLSKDVSLYADGGKVVKVVREFTTGKQMTLELLSFVFNKFQKSQSVVISEVNFQPALLFYTNGKLKTCQVFEIQNNHIINIYAVLDPEKLKSIS